MSSIDRTETPTLPIGYVSHTQGGRVRFRIPGRKGDDAYFAEVERQFALCENVFSVETNPLTGSVLLRHRTELPELVRFAQEHELFALQAQTAPEEPILALAARGIDGMATGVRRATQGSVSLSELLFVGLVGLSLLQILRRRALGPASALLAHAATLLALYRSRQAADR